MSDALARTDGAVVHIVDGATLTRTGLTITGDMPYERWEFLGQKLREFEGSVMWWIGDWLNYGEAAYGQKYTKALDATEYSYQTLRNAAWVSSQFELSLRRDNLGWSHHKELADLPTGEAVELLEWAEAGGLSVRELRALKQERRQQAYLARHASGEGGIALVLPVPAQELLTTLDDESFDLLLTDPPYSSEWADVEEFRAFVDSWLVQAIFKVKPTGRAYICIGAYPVELRVYLNLLADAEIPVENVLVWEYRNTLGPAPTHAYKQNCQAILYIRGEHAPPLDCPVMTEQFSVIDMRAPDGRQGDRVHAWQKPDDLAEMFLRHSTTQGDSVLDPFAGTGTFLAAAKRMGRKALGSETAPEMLALCEARGVKVVSQ